MTPTFFHEVCVAVLRWHHAHRDGVRADQIAADARLHDIARRILRE